MAAAACSAHCTLGSSSSKPQKEHLRRSRDSRRRQAALLFLSNISLDGRPVVQHVNNTSQQLSHRESEFLGTDNVSTNAARLSPASSSCGTFHNLSGSVSCGAVSSVPRLGVINVPPILVLPSDPGFNDVGTTEVFLERGRGSFSSQGNLLSPASLQPTPLGPRKSPTLLSVQSCNSVTLDSRPRWVTFHWWNSVEGNHKVVLFRFALCWPLSEGLLLKCMYRTFLTVGHSLI